jgi:hypothetical protein
MVKNLLKKIVVGGMIVGGLMLGSCTTNYNIYGYKTKYHHPSNDIMINKDGDKIRYDGDAPYLIKNIDIDELNKVKINSKWYRKKDTLIYPGAVEEFKNLKEIMRQEERGSSERNLEILRRKGKEHLL